VSRRPLVEQTEAGLVQPPADARPNFLALEVVDPPTIAIADLQRDAELACRAAGINKETVSDYKTAMLAGAVFPPIVVFRDQKGASWLADGFHRCAAAEAAGMVALPVDLRVGSRRDALLFAASANAAHGLRRTNADKRRAIELVLAAFPKWSDRKIAEACGVHNETVGAVRKRVTESVTPSDGPVAAAVAAAAPPNDALIARLTKVLDRLIQQWPTERRGELIDRLLEVATAPPP
jgi:ParB-like chromosome segregation protein Spo0J